MASHRDPRHGITGPGAARGVAARAALSVIRTYRRGPSSFFNLSAYTLGFTGLWTVVGNVLIQFKVLEIVASDQKNTYVGVIAVVGSVVGAAGQIGAGALSDRASGRFGKRIPFVVVGTLGLAASTMAFGAVRSVASLLLVVGIMQLFGNISQGAANALIVDHIDAGKRGAAAGFLKAAGVVGGGLAVFAALVLMSHYDPVTRPVFLWASLALIVVVLILTTGWTVATVLPRPGRGARAAPSARVAAAPVANRSLPGSRADDNSRDLRWFLLALALAFGGLGVIGKFALFFLTDVLDMENPAAQGQFIVVVVGVATLLSVFPAGALSDRIGRRPPLIASGLLSAGAALALLFIRSYALVLVDAFMIGIATGTFLSVIWALATDLTPAASAGKTLGLTAVSGVSGAIVPLAAGFVTDALNRRSPNLGYEASLVLVAVSALCVVWMLTRIEHPAMLGRNERARIRSAKERPVAEEPSV